MALLGLLPALLILYVLVYGAFVEEHSAARVILWVLIFGGIAFYHYS